MTIHTDSRASLSRSRRSRLRVRRALRASIAGLVAALMVIAGLAMPAVAEDGGPVLILTKELDSIQQGGNKTDVFQTGMDVRYRLKVSCSSLTEDCVTATLTDVLDPNLEYRQVVIPTGSFPDGHSLPTMTSSYDAGTHAVTINVGDAAKPFEGGDTLEFVVIARVKTQPASTDGSGFGVIPNSATGKLPNGVATTTAPVTIKVPTPKPNWTVTKTSDPQSIAEGESASYSIAFQAAQLGNLDASGIVIVDTYPAGAEVVDAQGGTVDTANHTITWTLGPAAISSAYCDGSGKCAWEAQKPIIKYPAAAFPAGATPTNNVRADVTYTNGVTQSLKASAITAIVEGTQSSDSFKNADATAAPGGPIHWGLGLRNTGTTTQPMSVVDTLPVETEQASFGAMYANSTLEALVGGVWTTVVVIGNDVSWGEHPIPAGATAFRYSVPALKPNEVQYLNVSGMVKADAHIGAVIRNCADMSLGKSVKTNCADTTIVEPFTIFQTKKIHKFSDPAASAVKPGEIFTFAVGTNMVRGSNSTKVNVSDILPAQFEYLGTTCVVVAENLGWAGPNASSLDAALADPTCADGAASTVTPTVAAQPDGSTNLSWKDVPTGFTDPGKIAWVIYTVQVKAGTAVGSYTNKAYLDSDEVDTRCASDDQQQAEPGDLDGDGVAGEDTCYTGDDVIVDEASIIDLSKWDKGPLPNVSQTTGQEAANCPDWEGYTRYPCVAQTPANSDFSYRFKLQNIGNVDATNDVMYDVLPHTGDTGVGQALSAATRGTEWTPNLTGPIVVESAPTSANVKIEYNLTYNPCRPELAAGGADAVWQASCDSTWYTAGQITDWSTVKSFRVTSFGDGARWKPAETVVLRADMHAPSTAEESKANPLDLSIAWNSAAHRVFRVNQDGSTVRLLAAEPRKVGVIVPFPGVSVGDYVWYDTDRDGIQDADEKPVPDVTVTLRDADGTVVGTTKTDANGYYFFQYLAPSKDYTVTFTAPDGYVFTKQNAGGDTSNSPTGDLTDSDADVKTGVIAFTTPADGDNLAAPGKADNPGLDAGFISAKVPVSIGDFVWFDANRNGQQDAGETPIGGVTVTLTRGGTTVGTTTTDADGFYAFQNLDPSTEYTVTFTAPSGYTYTTQNAGGDISNSPSTDLTDSDADPTTGAVTFTTPAGGANLAGHGAADNPGIDAGFVKLVSVGDYVWLDVNRDGLQGDPAVEKPIAGVTVTLTKGGATVATTTTNADGYYWFVDLYPGADYDITFTAPANHVFTTQNAGGVTSNSATGDLTDSDADPATGKVSFTAPTTGSNTGAAKLADNPGIDAGFVGPINLSLQKKLTTTGQFLPGKTVTFELTPHNDGPVAALKGWSVTDILPAGLTLTGMSGDGYTCDTPTATCIASSGLGVGADGAVITVTATIDAGVTGKLHNVAYVSPAGNERPETNVLVTPATTTDTSTTPTDNDAQADVTVASLVSLGDYVWWDENRNGQQDAGEKPVPGVTVVLLSGTDTTPMATTATDANGYYGFSGLVPGGAYTVQFVAPDGTVFTRSNTGADATDSDPAVDGTVKVTAPASGANRLGANVTDDPTIDAGLVKYNLTLTKTLTSSAPFFEGSTVTFTLLPHNDGPVAALAGWSVTDIMPTGLTLTALSGTGYTCDLGTATCMATGQLAAGADGNPITVTATVGAGLLGTARNIAYVSPAPGDVAETNPLVTPTKDTDTTTTPTDNDAQAPLTVDSLVSVGDNVWWDINRDGVQGDKAPVKDVTVKLYAADGTTVLATTTTDDKGFYSFTSLTPGRAYVIEFVAPTGSTFTTQNAGADDTVDSDADVVTGRVNIVAPASGSNSATTPDDPTIDAGLVRDNLSIEKTLATAGAVYAGSTVSFTLTPHNDGEVDAEAGWSIVDLLPASLTATAIAGEGYSCTLDTLTCVASAKLEAGATGAPVTVTAIVAAGVKGIQRNIAYVAPVAGDIVETNPLVVPTGSTDTRSTPTDNDAEAPVDVQPLVSVGDHVWMDTNRDGLQSEGEAPVAGVTVNIYTAGSDTPLKTTTTDENGFYSFTDLHAGQTYVIEFVKPDGSSFTITGGGVATRDSDADPTTGRVTITAPADGENSAITPDDPTFDAGLVSINLAIDKVLVTTGTVRSGSEVTYNLTVKNIGAADVLAGWTVTEQLPAGLTLKTISGDGFTCSGVVCTAKNPLAAGATAPVITVVATIDAGVTGELVNGAMVDASKNDVPEPTKTNNRDVVPVVVVPLPGTVVPQPGKLSVTGGQLAAGVLGLGVLALLGGAIILIGRRRRSTNRDS